MKINKLIENRQDINQIVFLSDVHFGVKNGSLEWLENMREYFDKFFIPLLKTKEKKNNPCVVVAGDYFDNRQNVDINVMNTAIDVMTKISEICPVYIMIGNHDIYKKSDTDVTSLRPMVNIDNVKVIPNMMELTIKGDKKFLLVSWVGDMKAENKIIASNKDNYDFLVFHTELSGMKYDNDRPIINGVNLDIVGDDCRILSGHIHKRQESKKGMYFGSPYHITRSDIGNTKGIYIFTVKDNGEIEREFVENTVSPRYLTVKFSDLGRNPEKWENVVRNNYIEIIFTDDELAKHNVNSFLDDIQKYGPKNIELKKEKKAIDMSEGLVYFDDEGNFVDLTVNTDATVEEVFEKRLEIYNLSKTKAKAMNKMNKEYLKRAEEELK